MTRFLDALEHQLIEATHRGARGATSSPGRLRQRRISMRLIAAAAALLLAIAAAALAAVGLLSGAPVALPRGIPLQPRSGLGVPVPGASTAITMQVSDPAGGPSWGARFIATTRGYGCLQFGRAVRGELGVIGQDGLFSDDGRFHALPTDYLDGPFPCAPLDARGHAFAGVFMDGTPAGGTVAEQTCSPPGRPIHPPTPVCPAKDERLLMAGMAGPLARTITYADPNGGLHTVPAVGPQGAYLIVLRATKFGLQGGGYEPGGPGLGTIHQITYANGQICHTGTETDRPRQACPPVGEDPIARPPVTAASVASPVSVVLANRPVQMRYETKVLPMFVIRFRARVPVTSGATGYLVSVSCGAKGNQMGAIPSDVRRGEIITQEVPRNGCRGIARIRVLYQSGGRPNGPPSFPGGTTFTVGTRTITVR
jgi:hypothetical protein